MRTKTPAAPTFTVVAETAYHPVIGSWVYKRCWVRLSDGTVDLYDLPAYPLGGAR